MLKQAIDEQRVLAFLGAIETGEVSLVAERKPTYNDDLLFFASNGWTIEVSVYDGVFGGILEIVTEDGTELDADYLDQHMKTVCVYFPDSKVSIEKYGLPAPGDK